MSTCAMCEHWTLKTDPARAAAGVGHCTGFLVAAMDFTDWAQPKCGLYRSAKQMAAREKWISARNAPAESAIRTPAD